MKTPLSSTTLLRPRTLSEALAMLRDEGPLTPVAGCTDLYVGFQFGTVDARRFLDLWPLDELRGVQHDVRTLRIGALTTFADIIASPAARRLVPMLVAASREIGGKQIQNRGTIGGNIANASPAGDSLPVLAAADAILELRSAAGTRRVPFNEFYTGYRTSVRRADELIASVEIPPIQGTQWWRKVGTRRAQAISKTMLAAVRPVSSRGRVARGTWRIAIGSVAPTVLRLRHTEAVLDAGASIDDACQALVSEIAPIDDVRSTKEYRTAVSANLLRRFWTETA
jgi:CO/xanthine dehydrogenase FAD-binding subunit